MTASDDRVRFRLGVHRGVSMAGLTMLLVVVTGCGGDTPAATTVAAPETTSPSTTLSPTTTIAAPETSPSTTLPTTTVDTPETSLSTTLSPTTTTPFAGVIVEVSVNNGEVSGGGRIAIELGSPVRLIVTADVSDEIHLHGYDLTTPVTPSETAQLDFVADIPGVFEVELEESGVELADLEVAP